MRVLRALWLTVQAGFLCLGMVFLALGAMLVGWAGPANRDLCL